MLTEKLKNDNIFEMQILSAQKREILGKKVKNLRKEGFIPAVVYGGKTNSSPITVRENDFVKVWKSEGESSIILLEVDGKKENVLIHSIAFDPIKDNPIHVDFLVVDMDKPIKVDVKINFVGESAAIKLGGSLVKIVHELHVEALPKNLPQEIEVDISSISKMEDSIKVEDIKISGDFKILNNPTDIIALVEAPKTEEELAAEETAEAKSIEDIEVVGKKEKEESTEEETKEEKPEKKEDSKEK